MKKIKIWGVVLLALTLTTLNAQTKRYEVKSGIVEYKISQSGNMMGVKIQGNGTAKTVFKEWGDTELHSEESRTITMGTTEHTKQMMKIENGKVYHVDFDQKVIYEQSIQDVMHSEDKELVMSGKEMLTSMGGKKIGEEKFMGYACEIWEMMQVKVWIHKGIMLKSEADIMGIKNTTVATKIELDVSVSDALLQLPDYPIKKGAKQNNMMPEMTPEQMQQMQEMMKNFTKK